MQVREYGKAFATRQVSFWTARPHLITIALGILLAGLFASGLRIVREPAQLDLIPGQVAGSRSDFDDYYRASRAFAAGDTDPYHINNLTQAARLFGLADQDPNHLLEAILLLRQVGSYLYPPWLAFLLTPLTVFSYPVAAVLFQLASVLSLALALYIMRRMLVEFGNLSIGEALLACLLTLVAIAAFMDGNAANGNVGFFLIALFAAVLYGLLKPGWRYTLLAGFLLGIAIAIKVTPVFWGLLILATRRWLAGIMALLGLVLALFLPGFFYGHARNLVYLHDWYDLILHSYQKLTFIRSWTNNQSIVAAVGRFFLEGQDAAQYQWGLPWLVWPALHGGERLEWFAALSQKINLSWQFALLILAVRIGLRDGIAMLWSPAAWLARTAEYRLIGQRAFIWLLVWLVSVSLFTAGVSWFHAYSMLFVPLVLYCGRRLVEIRAGRWTRPLWSERVWLGMLLLFGLFFLLLPSLVREGLAMYAVFVALQCLVLPGLWIEAWRGPHSGGAKPDGF
ncbi:MAG: DUF2029 domain-containing protein [Leptospiraceae bacterium]|nr:DUF2029 domain-containing protein [Leptospiraceae bacterium]